MRQIIHAHRATSAGPKVQEPVDVSQIGIVCLPLRAVITTTAMRVVRVCVCVRASVLSGDKLVCAFLRTLRLFACLPVCARDKIQEENQTGPRALIDES